MLMETLNTKVKMEIIRSVQLVTSIWCKTILLQIIMEQYGK